MAIDASIISGLKPVQLESPVNALAQMLQVQSAQQQNQLGQMKMDEYNRGKERQNRLFGLMQSLPPTATDDDRVKALRSGSYFDEADKLEAGIGARRKIEADAADKEWGVKKQKLTVIGSAFGGVMKNPTLENALGTIDLLAQQGVLPDDAAGRYRQIMQSDPTQIAPLAEQAYRAALEADKQLMTIQARDLGGTTQTTGFDPVTGKATVLRTDVNTQSPDNRATVSASLANAAATREVAAATRDAARIQRDQATEMKLADDYRGQSKGFKEVSDAHKQLNATLDKATTSPAAALAGATKFMKLLDPGSVVRESELGMALAATGVLDRATNYVETLKYGKVLTPAQVADFKNITQQIYTAAQDGQRAIDANYRNQAKTYNLRPEMIVQDLGQNTKPAATTVRKFNPATGRIE